MSAQQTVSQSASGFPLISILTVIFVLAKLTNVIDWSWWWVFAPLWLPLVIFFGVILIVLMGLGFVYGFAIGLAGLIDFFGGIRRGYRRSKRHG